MGSQRHLSKFKATTNKSFNFAIKVEVFEKLVFDPIAGSYTQYVVGANGFVIAHFVDQISAASYLEYLSKFGFSKFPTQVIDIIRSQFETDAIKGRA